MRKFLTVVAALVGLLAVMRAAEARVLIQVDLGAQTMHVSSAAGDYDWPISSARTGYRTPRGTFGVTRLETMHYSHKYHNSPMPHSIFFAGGYAIHGTYATGALGRPASHGCIRIAPGNAAVLYQLVRQEGARIAINGTAPASGHLYAKREGRPLYAAARSRPRAVTGYMQDGYVYNSYGEPLGYARSAPDMHRFLLDPTDW
jgi:hypothetical protein